MSNISKDLMAASSIPLLLSIIKIEDTYGYEIMNKVRELSDGYIELKDGTLYPILKKLEKKELIRSTWRQTLVGKKRKYYSITMKGRNELIIHQEQWQFINGMLAKVWNDK